MSASPIPLRLGTPEEFACVREFFRRARFNDAEVSRLLAMDDMSDLGRVRWDEVKNDSLSASMQWCIQVFLRSLRVEENESTAVCGETVFRAFRSLGLLRPAKASASSFVCPVWLYPVDGFLVVSDRRDDPDGNAYEPPEDVVFPAIYAGTLRFLRLLPEARGDALDLCGGSGIGALHLARTARRAASADLTERSAFFADFNAQLNGISIESLCGDVYEPAAGRKFDLICAHPPFVPATGDNMVYRDGGETCEEVTRRIVEGLPAHLSPGGTSVILCVARDTSEETFEQRARGWLGDEKEEFDIVFGLEKVLSVDEVVQSMRNRGQHIGDVAAKQLADRLRSAGTKQFVYGALVVRREEGSLARQPIRIRMTPAAEAPHFNELFEWRRHRCKADFAQWLAKAQPRPARELELTVRHVVRDGELVPVEFVFSREKGFHAALRPDGWVVPLLARLDGRHSVAEIFDTARLANELPDGFSMDAFAQLVERMIERGFLEVEFPR